MKASLLTLVLYACVLKGKSEVPKIKAKIGDFVNMSWTVQYFRSIHHIPQKLCERNQKYYHGHRNELNKSKYNYTSQPFDSKVISFSIRDISLQDAGYYAGEITFEDVGYGDGVVLIVLGKPKINGNLNIPVGLSAELTCSSNLSFSPDYYAKLVKMTYAWFENDTRLNGETGQNLRLKVTKNHSYNRYTCTARDNELESDRSESVQINPLYNPDKLTITPQPPPNDRLTVKEGETIGPYNCSADCNPPCVITWKRKDTDGIVTDALSLDLDQPAVNGQQILDKNNMLQISEMNPIHISCFVNSNPDSVIQLRKKGRNLVTNQFNTQWLNHTLDTPQCSDSGTYECVGISTGFNSTEKTFEIDVTCKPRIDGKIKSIYGSKSGRYVTVVVPVIGNPPPQESRITWSGPMGDLLIKSTVFQQDISYKHWINSFIPITDQSYFGNYTLKYNGDDIFTLTVIAEDVPQPPVSFTGYSNANGYINLRWVSGFNGGQEQHFILLRKEKSSWKEVKSISDPGEGRVVDYSYGPSQERQDFWFRIKSCNIIGCSSQTEGIKIFTEGLTPLSVDQESNSSSQNTLFYVCIAFLLLSVSLNLFLIAFIIIKHRVDKRRPNKKKTIGESGDNKDSEDAHLPSDAIYKNTEREEACYQEIGQIDPQSAVYETLTPNTT